MVSDLPRKRAHNLPSRHKDRRSEEDGTVRQTGELHGQLPLHVEHRDGRIRRDRTQGTHQAAAFERTPGNASLRDSQEQFRQGPHHGLLLHHIESKSQGLQQLLRSLFGSCECTY